MSNLARGRDHICLTIGAMTLGVEAKSELRNLSYTCFSTVSEFRKFEVVLFRCVPATRCDLGNVGYQESGAVPLHLEQGDASQSLSELAVLFERNQQRVGQCGHELLFKWYYSDSGLGTPYSWFLRDDVNGRLAGVCSVSPRTMRINDEYVRAGLIGNFLIDGDKRNTFGAFHRPKRWLIIIRNIEAYYNL